MTERRILVVDDDESIRTLLTTVLRRSGFVVDAAGNGAEAIERMRRCDYALVLLDLMMPRLNGYDVLAHLEQRPPEARPVVIVLTAGIDPRTLDGSVVAATMRKPFDIQLLVETIASSLETIPPRAQSPDCPPAENDRASRNRTSS